MMSNVRYLAATLAVAIAAAACGGGSGSSSLPNTPKPTSLGPTYATFVVKIPARASGKGTRRPHYITSNVQGISFNVADATNPDLGTVTFFALTPTSPGCSGTIPSGVTCTLDVVAAPGNDTFVVDLYDSTEINGAYVVSSGTLTQTIAAQASNTINIVTDGVPTFAVMGLSNPYPSAAATFPLTMYVTDADGDIIVGSYDAPLSLTDSDTSGATSLSATTLANPAATSGVTLTWNGTALASPATITLSSTDTIVSSEVGSTALATTTFSPGVSAPLPSVPAFYFANPTAAAQTLNVTGANGSAGPFTALTTGTTGNSCAGIVTISAGPPFTITPMAATSIPGGVSQLYTLGSCYIGVTDDSDVTTSIGVIVGAGPTPTATPTSPP